MFRLFRRSSECTGLPRFAYRLRRQHNLVPGRCSARVLQAVTRMQFGPVSREWFERTSGLASPDAESLLMELLAQGAVEEIDISGFGALAQSA